MRRRVSIVILLQRFAFFGFGVRPHFAFMEFEMMEGAGIGPKGFFGFRCWLSRSLKFRQANSAC
jgi:hypothetical protein